MNFFLAKTDPETYSIEDFEKEGVTLWDGVHNYQAINFIKQWEVGDLVLIYSSMGRARISGLSVVVSKPRINIDDPRHSFVADLKFIAKLNEENQTSLKEIKNTGLFDSFALVKQSRLSVMKCPDEFIQWLINYNHEFAKIYENYLTSLN